MGKLLMVAILFAALVGCSNRNTPEHTAEDFVYNYYLHANQDLALPLTDGLAREKLTEEIELLRSIRSGSEQINVHPEIEYKLIHRKDQDATHVSFRYQLTIKNTSISDTVRNTIILTESIDGRWKVINFDEYAE